MADTQSHTPAQATPGGFGSIWKKIDKAWLASAVILAVLALVDMDQFGPTLTFAARALANTAPIILIAVLAIGYLKASGAETTIAKAFEGNEVHMIFMAALLGGLSPFCSCEVIPFIAALLAVGTPLSAVMAFWLASPLMDPAMFVVTAGALGLPFAVGKTVAAVAVGLLGGFVAMAAKRSAVFADPLREKPQVGDCCGVKKPFAGKPVWKFWAEPERRETFRRASLDNAVFLLKWLLLAYLIESLMLAYVPAEWIAGVLGGEGFMPILMGALVGAPAYLNGYAAVQLVDGLLAQGMAPGAAMSFVVAGGVTCIPAAIAVWALVKPRVFAAYVGLAMVGALCAGLAWSVAASLIA
ncbi:permease [Pseudooceanicola sp. MF1-13]|uniref:permease n=1 Tax=Pseudooceanicola sp. MF1-13 TaxID=3379095 RepID=UPI003891A313